MSRRGFGGFLAGLAGPRAIPHIEAKTSGAACLAMVLAHHGARANVAQLDRELGAADPRGLLEAAARRGLSGRCIQVDPAVMTLLPRAAILEWQTGHFVVFDGPAASGIRIVDPVRGPRTVGPDELAARFTGVALVVEPGRLRRGGARRLLAELAAERAVFGRILVASFLVRLFALAVPLMTALVVDQVVPRGDRHLLLVAALGVGVLVSFDALSSIVRAHLVLHLRNRIEGRMARNFLDRLVALPASFFLTRRAPALRSLVGAAATARETLTSGALASLLDGCTAILYAAVIAVLSPRLGLLVAILAGLHVALFLGTRRRHRELVAIDLDAQTRAQDRLDQILAGMESLKCAGAENRAVAKWAELHAAHLDVALERGSLGAGVDSVRRALESLAPLGVLSIGAIAVTSGQLSLGSMLAVSALAGGLFAPLSALVAGALQLQLVAREVERMDDALDGAADVELGAPPHRLEGAIAVRQVSFRYGDGASAVSDVSLDIPAGSSVAIVGPSGSGKSTLANLLVGLLRPCAGEIYYDGRAQSQIDLRALRRQIGAVPQSPFLFAGSVRENIALADADQAQIEWAARAACIHESIEAMPRGYDTEIAAGGASLPRADRQRIAIARALVGGPAVVMLDEATSALDGVTENRVMNQLGQLRATRIIVAHRLATVVDADLIVVMDAGRVVETGTHRELLAARGRYAALVGGRRANGERPPLEIAS